MTARRTSGAVLGLAACGIAISGTIAWVHARLESVAGYVSFCNVNERANCDVVLQSRWAYVLGVPVAWWAILAYAGFAAAALYVLAGGNASRRRQVALGSFLAAIAAVGYSAFLAGVSVWRLHAVCLLCSGLYLVNAGLLVATWGLCRSLRQRGRAPLAGGRVVVLGAAAMAALVAGLAAWAVTLPTDAVDPDFEAWYRAQPVVDVDLPPRHARGQGREVRIVEFSDFECGFCAKAARGFHELLARYGDTVRLQFHHFPLDPRCNPAVPGGGHAHACMAAEAAECAGRQGRFWEYHDVLFENQKHLGRQRLIEYADRVGLDTGQFVACLDRGTTRELVRADAAAGARLGVEATPTLFINGRVIRGALDPERLAQAIRIERKNGGGG